MQKYKIVLRDSKRFLKILKDFKRCQKIFKKIFWEILKNSKKLQNKKSKKLV